MLNAKTQAAARISAYGINSMVRPRSIGLKPLEKPRAPRGAELDALAATQPAPTWAERALCTQQGSSTTTKVSYVLFCKPEGSSPHGPTAAQLRSADKLKKISAVVVRSDLLNLHRLIANDAIYQIYNRLRASFVAVKYCMAVRHKPLGSMFLSDLGTLVRRCNWFCSTKRTT